MKPLNRARHAGAARRNARQRLTLGLPALGLPALGLPALGLLGAALLLGGCASQRERADSNVQYVYVGQQYYAVPYGYQPHCHNGRLSVSATAGSQTQVDGGDWLAGAPAVEQDLSGSAVLAIEGQRCHYGVARYRQPPRLVASAGANLGGGRVGIGIGASRGGSSVGVSVGGGGTRVGGSVSLP